MACETAVERAFAHHFEKRGFTTIRDSVEAFFPSYNLANERIRTLYVALSGDPIHECAFWPRLKQAIAVRNRITHEGARASSEEAAAAVAVATEFVEHIARVISPR